MNVSLADIFSDLSNTLKLGWIITGNIDVAGARIHGWVMDDFFGLSGFDSQILWAAEKYTHKITFTQSVIDDLTDSGVNIIMLQGVKYITHEDFFFDQCYRSGIKVMLVDSDNINMKIANRCDGVIVVNNYLKSLFSSDMQEKVFVAIDHYEHDGSKVKKHSDKKELNMCFLSNNVYDIFPGLESLPEHTSLKIIGPSKKRVKKYTSHKKLFTQTSFGFEYVLWNLDTIEENILDCDIGLIPYPQHFLDAEYIKCKSNNRLVLFMSYGIPCIVSPIEPYMDLIEHGINGFFASTPQEWEQYVTLLRDDPLLREQMGALARVQVIGKYSVYEQAKQYLQAMDSVFKK